MATTPGGKGNKKKGRWVKKPCNVRYKANHNREKNKLKRVLKSSGLKAAEEYSRTHGVSLRALLATKE